MRGILLAGGSGTRLDPLTQVTNKHLLPVFDRPMIYFGLQLLASAGIDHVVVVTGGPHAGAFLPIIRDGSAWGLSHVDYAYQQDAAGIADALRCAAPFVQGSRVCVLLGDNIFEKSIKQYALRFEAQKSGARVLLAPVAHPEHYGVALMDGTKLVAIVEKPTVPTSNLAVTGCYFYDEHVFELVASLSPSARGELEITDINDLYLKRGTLEHDTVDGYWIDCGESFSTYREAANLVAIHGAGRD